MSVYKILQQLELTTKKTEKEAILSEHKDNEVLKECFRLTYSPTINFFMKQVPLTRTKVEEVTLQQALVEIMKLANREVTGNEAKMFVKTLRESMDYEDSEVIYRILKGDMGCGVGISTINKTWKGLIVKPPRMGAKSMNEKSLKALEGKPLAIELKSDGSYLAFNKDLTSRNGNPVTVETLELHLNCGAFEGFALEGEGVFDLTKATREVGNGILGKIIKGTASEEEKDGMLYQVWDCIDVHHYQSKGKYSVSNVQRRIQLETMYNNYLTFCNDKNIEPKIQLIPRTEDVTIETAHEVFQDYVKEGFEGAILKDMSAGWSDNGKPTCCVKLKRKDPADLLVVDIYEGVKGKALGKLGGVSLESECGRIKVNCGSGFSDEEREFYWNNPNEMLGKIVEVEYDSITKDKKTLQESLFLPIYKKLREDKLEADSYDEIKAKVRIK